MSLIEICMNWLKTITILMKSQTLIIIGMNGNSKIMEQETIWIYRLINSQDSDLDKIHRIETIIDLQDKEEIMENTYFHMTKPINLSKPTHKDPSLQVNKKYNKCSAMQPLCVKVDKCKFHCNSNKLMSQYLMYKTS